jgi:hypothetical protein
MDRGAALATEVLRRGLASAHSSRMIRAYSVL